MTDSITPIQVIEANVTRPTSKSTRFATIVHGGVGLLLLTAAGLKLYGLNVSPFAQYGWLLKPIVQSIALVWELFLGVWLLSGKASRFVWWLTVATFALFALVSGSLVVLGQANCGCFGVIQASPWVALGVDVVVLFLLAATRSSCTNQPNIGLGWVGGVGAILVAMFAMSLFLFGSLETAMARLRGQTLSISTPLDFGNGTAGEVLIARATVRNWTSSPLRLIGGTSDCSCLATEDLPITIPAQGEVEIRVSLRIPSDAPGQLTRVVNFVTDCPKHPRLRLAAIANVE